MIGKTDKNPQLNIFRTPLVSVINMKHELVELAQRINWKSVEKDFVPYYADMGRPAVPIRKMVGCMWFGPLLIGLFYRRLNIHKSFALNLS